MSKLEAMQLTMLTVPTLMARFPGGRARPFRFVMIPGNEPTGDGRYVGITTVTAAAVAGARCSAMGRDDLADDDELGTMIGRFVRADEVQRALHAFTTGAHRRRDRGRVRRRRVSRSRSSATARCSRSSSTCATRDVFVAQPGESWVRPRAPFRFHGVADRALGPRPREADRADGVVAVRPRREPRRRLAPSASVRSRACASLDFTAFWAGPVRDRVARGDGRRRDQGRVGAAARRHPVQRRGAPDAGPAVLREVGAVPRGEPRQARASRSTSVIPTGCDLAKRLVARVRRRRRELHAAGARASSGLDYDEVRAIRPDVVMLRLPAFGLTGPWRDRPGFAQTMEQLTGMAWVTGYEGGPPIIPGGVGRPDGRHARRARDRRRARAPRPHR